MLLSPHWHRQLSNGPSELQDPPTPFGALTRLLKNFLKFFTGAAALTALALLVLPSALSTTKGLQVATAVASKLLPGTLQIEEAHLGWTKPVRLSGVIFKAPSILGGEALASVPTLTTSARLWDIVCGKAFDAYATSPTLDCTLSASGQLKWMQLMDYESGKAAASSKSYGRAQGEGQATQYAPIVTDTTELPFTGEARLAAASLYVSEGTLKVPQEVKEVIGQDLHLVAVAGSANLRDATEEFLFRSDWVGGVSSEGGTESPSAAHSLGQPAVLAVRSEHLDFEVAGWQEAGGRLRLRNPASAQLQFTPALARYGLARISPLLSGILAVEEGVVKLEVDTPDMRLPSTSYHMRFEPLRVAVNRKDFLAKAIEFLRLKESKEIAQRSLLQGATSALHVDIDETGAVSSKRLDLLISTDREHKGVHLCTWGEIDPVTGSMDIALGVPHETLEMIGLRGLPERKMLVIPVKGSTTEPRVDWVQAYKRLAALAATSKTQPTSLRGQILQGIVQGLDLRANAPGLAEAPEPPLPVEQLPWEADQLLPRQDVEVN